MTVVKPNFSKMENRDVFSMAKQGHSAARKEVAKRALKGDPEARMIASKLVRKKRK